MGMYTGVKFKGIVREKFRQEFDRIVIKGRWDLMSDPLLKEFGDEQHRAPFIPLGMLNSMPDQWYQNETPQYWNEETGEWKFQCSVKNENDVVGDFIDLTSYLCDEAEIEEYYEIWEYSRLWKVENRTTTLVNPKHRKYGEPFENF